MQTLGAQATVGTGTGADAAVRAITARNSWALPPMHRTSRTKSRGVIGLGGNQPRRYARKICDGRSLYLLVMLKDCRCWRSNYRFGGKPKTIALGVHSGVSLMKAHARHQVARTMLADGIDLSASRRTSAVAIFSPDDFTRCDPRANQTRKGSQRAINGSMAPPAASTH